MIIVASFKVNLSASYCGNSSPSGEISPPFKGYTHDPTVGMSRQDQVRSPLAVGGKIPGVVT